MSDGDQDTEKGNPTDPKDKLISVEALATTAPSLGTGTFDHAHANVFVSEDDWDGLLRYLNQFYSEDSCPSMKLVVHFERESINLIKMGLLNEALESLNCLVEKLLETHPNEIETERWMQHLAVLQDRLQIISKRNLDPHSPISNLCVFESEAVERFFNKKDLGGLKAYLDGFLSKLPHGRARDQHPVLELIILELEFAVAHEEKILDRSDKILKLIDGIKDLPKDLPFMPLDLSDRVKKAKTPKKFDDIKMERMASLLDYIRLYFRKHFRPRLDNDNTFLKFSMRLESGKLKCLACGYTFEKNRGEISIKYHITRSEKARLKKMKMCDATTARLIELAAECVDSESSSSSHKRTRGSQTGKQPKRSKMSDRNTGELSEVCSNSALEITEKENQEDVQASCVAALILKTSRLLVHLKSANLMSVPGVAEVQKCVAGLQSNFIFDPTLESQMDEIGKLEKAAENVVMHFSAVPEKLQLPLSEFIEAIFKLRCIGQKQLARDFETSSAPIFTLASDILKLCLQLSRVHSISTGEFSERERAALEGFEAEVLNLFKELLGGKFDFQKVVNRVSSIRSLAVQLYVLAEARGLGGIVKELQATFQTFWCACLKEQRQGSAAVEATS